MTATPDKPQDKGGARPSGTGSRASTEPQEGLGPSGFDPARKLTDFEVEHLAELEDFVRESNRIEGIMAVTNEQIYAHWSFLERPRITVEDLVALVAVLQPDARLRDSPKVPGVRVGNYVAPPSGPHIREELERILKMPGSSFAQHIAYETLHPFTDGNGRSGRALWLHRRGGYAPLGFLHSFYYQTLDRVRAEKVAP